MGSGLPRRGGPPGRLPLFLALSRTPHAALDLATPALGAVIALGGLPPPGTAALGLGTAFAAYTAVYALNDLVVHRVDQEKIRRGGLSGDVEYLDAVGVIESRFEQAMGTLLSAAAAEWLAFVG